jgi:hypothetical protein
MRLLKAAITKVTSPLKKLSIKQPLEFLEGKAFDFYYYYTQKNIAFSEKKKLKQKWLKVLKKS